MQWLYILIYLSVRQFSVSSAEPESRPGNLT